MTAHRLSRSPARGFRRVPCSGGSGGGGIEEGVDDDADYGPDYDYGADYGDDEILEGTEEYEDPVFEDASLEGELYEDEPFEGELGDTFEDALDDVDLELGEDARYDEEPAAELDVVEMCSSEADFASLTPDELDAGAPDLESLGGCSAAPGRGSSWWLASLALLGLARRRRRSAR
jgi:MYXO-CTERM domain-containing protein